VSSIYPLNATPAKRILYYAFVYNV